MCKSIYETLKNTGAQMSNHYSDLYVEITPETTAIINDYDYKCNITTFINKVTLKPNYEVPFSYDYKKLGNLS